MDIKLFTEDDGTFWAKISIGEEVIFAQWETMETLWEDMRGGLACAFDEKSSKGWLLNNYKQQQLTSFVKFFHPSFVKNDALVS